MTTPKVILILTCLFLTGLIYGQTYDTLNLNLNGFFYSPQNKHMYEKTFMHPQKDTYVRYSAKDFKKGLSVIAKDEFFLKNNTVTSINTIKYGVIDTMGKMLIPCIYDNLAQIPSENGSAYFILVTQDSVTLLNIRAENIFTLKQETPKNYQKLRLEKYINFINIDSFNNLQLSYNGLYQIYNLKTREFIFPSSPTGNNIHNTNYGIVEQNNRFVLYSNTPFNIDFDELKKYEDIFGLYGQSLNFYIYDKKNVCFSSTYKLVSFYNDSLIFLQDTIGNSYLTTTPCSPRNLYNFDYLEVFPATEQAPNFAYSSDYNLNSYRSRKHASILLAKNKHKYGLLKTDSTILIPFIYDDIYVINDSLVWVKKNNYWAVSTINHTIITDFEFIDIDKMGQTYFNNLLFYSRIDSSIIGKTFHRFVHAHDHDISDISVHAGLIKRFEKSHNYYTNLVGLPLTYRNNQFVAKKNDGYHFLTLHEYAGVFKVKVDSNHYDNILLVPKYQPGLQKGNKYGILPEDIKYDRVLIDLKSGIYDFYGTYYNRIYIRPELLQKKGKTYGYLKYPEGKNRNQLKRLF